jgi:hypothetical protein
VVRPSGSNGGEPYRSLTAGGSIWPSSNFARRGLASVQWGTPNCRRWTRIPWHGTGTASPARIGRSRSGFRSRGGADGRGGPAAHQPCSLLTGTIRHLSPREYSVLSS